MSEAAFIVESSLSKVSWSYAEFRYIAHYIRPAASKILAGSQRNTLVPFLRSVY